MTADRWRIDPHRNNCEQQCSIFIDNFEPNFLTGPQQTREITDDLGEVARSFNTNLLDRFDVTADIVWIIGRTSNVEKAFHQLTFRRQNEGPVDWLQLILILNLAK